MDLWFLLRPLSLCLFVKYCILTHIDVIIIMRLLCGGQKSLVVVSETTVLLSSSTGGRHRETNRAVFSSSAKKVNVPLKPCGITSRKNRTMGYRGVCQREWSSWPRHPGETALVHSHPKDTSEYDLIMDKYHSGNENGTLQRKGGGGGMQNGVFTMLLVNFALHAVVYFWNPAILQCLALSHLNPKPWQFVTAAFVHANWDHVFGNAFSLLVFGRMVEEEEGAFGVWATYIICGICGNLASYLSSPGTASVSLGASSAVFGLFVVGVLSKLRPSVRQLLEAVILGSYVVKQVLQEVQMVTSGSSVVAGAMTVGHMAHLGGALGGVLLVLFLSRLPPI